MTKPVRLMIVDDHPVILDGFIAMLKDEENILVVGCASTGEEALQQMPEFKPDVVLMDINLKPSGMNGLQTTAQFKSRYPDVRVLLMTGEDHRSYHVEAGQLGAMGCISKDWPTASILMAIDMVNKHIEVFPRSFLPETPLASPDGSEQALTPMEKSVFMLLLRGSSPNVRRSKSNATIIIADELGITERTCSEHRARIKAKLGGSLIPLEMVRYALKHGWLRHEDLIVG